MPEQGKERGLLSRKDQKSRLKKGKSYLLGIGIDQYEAFPNLNNAVKDVKDFKAVLEQRYELHEVVLLFNEQATRQGIIKELDKLKNNAQPEDKVLIYYSGHGHLDNRKRGYWIPFDAEKDYTAHYVRNGTVRDYLQDIEARHILLISDSCFSGALFVRGTKRSTTVVAEELELRQSRWALCSGRHDEEVADGTPGENSPFAKSILKELGRNQQAYLNIAKLADLVIEQTRANYAQLPEGNPVYGVGHEGGQYIFRLKAGVAEAWAACEKEGTVAAYQAFLAKYPDSSYADDARQQIAFLEEEAAWAQAKTTNTKLAYYTYDNQYPDGKYSRLAWELIKELEEEEKWQQAKLKNISSAYREYLQVFPNGKYSKEASAQIAIIFKAAQEAQKRLKQQKEEQDRIAAEVKAQEALEKAKREERKLKEQNLWHSVSQKNTILAYQSYLKQYPNGPFAALARSAIQKIELATKKEEARQAIRENKKEQIPQVLGQASPTSKKNYALIIGAFLGVLLLIFGVRALWNQKDPNTTENTASVASKVMKDGRRWTTENLNINVSGSYCYDDKSANCSKYGRLYTWEAAKAACKKLGSGWRLPTYEEWRNMAKEYGGADDNARDKAAYQSLIKGGDSGFAALLSGVRFSGGIYYGEGLHGHYWSSLAGYASEAWYYRFSSIDGMLYQFISSKSRAFSCRCIQVD